MKGNCFQDKKSKSCLQLPTRTKAVSPGGSPFESAILAKKNYPKTTRPDTSLDCVSADTFARIEFIDGVQGYGCEIEFRSRLTRRRAVAIHPLSFDPVAFGLDDRKPI